jgi:hypothetical protein
MVREGYEVSVSSWKAVGRRHTLRGVWIDALGPDRCRDDRCAPCAYWHLKLHALNGGRATLSAEELEFVGVVSRRRDVSGGWRQPSTLPASLSPDGAMLQALMSIEAVDLGCDRLRFLGG